MLLHENEPDQILLSKILALHGKVHISQSKLRFDQLAAYSLVMSGTAATAILKFQFKRTMGYWFYTHQCEKKKKFERNAVEIEQCLRTL